VTTLKVDHGRTVEITARELTDAEIHDFAKAFARDGIRIEPVLDIFGVLHLWALEPTTIAQEVAVLRAVAAVTDSRLAWHKAGAS
jgi:hypothetical protein